MPIDFLYQARGHEKEVFGLFWCGPDTLPHAEDVLIARFPKSPEDGDGQSVEVLCMACPARFYTLKVSPDPDSLGEPQLSYEVHTGSAQHELSAKIAFAISEGMLVFKSSGGYPDAPQKKENHD